MGKVYAVKTGRKTGKFYNWDECKKQVHGYSGAVYKSFENEKEADEYLADALVPDNALTAYVDGSFDPDQNAYSAGVVFIKDGRVIDTISQRGDGKYLSMRNIAGEIDAALIALRYEADHNESQIVIYHDYIGLGCWATGEWKADKDGSVYYKTECEKYRSLGIHYHFVKVKGHSGNKYNEMADQLAKKALGLIDGVKASEENKKVIEYQYETANETVNPDIQEKTKETELSVFTGSGVVDRTGRQMSLCDPFLCDMFGKRFLGYLDFDDFSQCYFLHFVGEKPKLQTMPIFRYAPDYEDIIDKMAGEENCVI